MAFPTAAQRPCPTCSGPVGFALTNSIWTRCLTPRGRRPKSGPAAKAYFDAHVARWKKEPDRWASAHAWAGLQILEQAVAKAGLDRKALRDAIANGKFNTIIGEMRFRNGENISTPGVVSQWQSGEFEVVWPPQNATAPALFPKPDWK